MGFKKNRKLDEILYIVKSPPSNEAKFELDPEWDTLKLPRKYQLNPS
jgi:hypothetical protein